MELETTANRVSIHSLTTPTNYSSKSYRMSLTTPGLLTKNVVINRMTVTLNRTISKSIISLIDSH